ncbi:exporter of polyketide antibiotics [Paractinoplanes deccanensis]|uniref:Exporter of polyketide antibiotics n=1 Tax=Paractinoplanes deccanensis TaxID=113561 RepID=A0ABQ3YJU3_9ACTN|nr:ABC transporter permease [Actinoplanes deccanensis]GID80274.1 exporter of polyketide antibiotics [Actinoplanes deccanensis]
MTGTGRLVRLLLRRDRVVLPLWVIVLALVPAGYVASFEGLFPTLQDRIEYASVSASNAGFVALYGLLKGSSLGELVAWRAGFLPVLAGLFAALTVIRHTRADEEAGRTELVAAGAVGRHAQLAAALITTCVASLVLGALLTAAMIAQDMPAEGSLAFGAEMALSGCAFAAVGAVAAQLTPSARSARTIAVVALGAAYALRLAGDISALGDGAVSWLSWLSPIGWVQHIFPYGANDWWPALLTLVFVLAVGAVAAVLLARRDFGAGLFPARLGPATSPMATPPALAWRLHRGPLLGWTVGFALLGLIFGGVGGSVVDLIEDNDGLGDIFARLGGTTSLVDNYFAGIAGLVGLIASCYAVQAALRLRDEEQSGHAEPLLATAVSRPAWAASHLLFALLGPAVALLAEGLTAGLTYTDGDLGAILASTLIQLPAVWVLAAVAFLLFGLAPRLSAAAWGAPALCLLILLVGQTLQLDQWLLDLSPFTHIPHLPGGTVAATPLVALVAVAAVLTAAGLTGFRRRNVPD